MLRNATAAILCFLTLTVAQVRAEDPVLEKKFVCPRCQDKGKIEGTETFTEHQRAVYECERRNLAEQKERRKTREDLVAVIARDDIELARRVKEKLEQGDKVSDTAGGHALGMEGRGEDDDRCTGKHYHTLHYYYDWWWRRDDPFEWVVYKRADGSFGIKRHDYSQFREHCECATAKQMVADNLKLTSKDQADLDKERLEERKQWNLTVTKIRELKRNIERNRKELERLNSLSRGRTVTDGGTAVGGSDVSAEKAKVEDLVKNQGDEIERLMLSAPDAFVSWLRIEQDFVIRKQIADRARKAALLLGAAGSAGSADPQVPKGESRYTFKLNDGTTIGVKMYIKGEDAYMLQLEGGKSKKVPLGDVAEVIDNTK